jgi:membrane-associated phospholipid phosphatase
MAGYRAPDGRSRSPWPADDPSVLTHHPGVDGLVVAYLAFTSGLYWRNGWPSRSHLLLFGLHWIGIFAIAALRRFLLRCPPGTWAGLRFLHAWYPAMILPLVYRELAVLNRIVTDRYYDAWVLQWEARLFGGFPVLTFSQRIPHPWVSEILHFGYVSYYTMIPALGLTLYLSRRYRAFHAYMFTLMATFFFCYLWFIFFPVEGPHYAYPTLEGSLQDGWFRRWALAVLARGAARGAAFPSSHVAAAVVTVLGAYRWDRRVFWVLLPLGTALTLGTVYGRFHYAVDALAGLVVAGLFAVVGPLLYERLGPRPLEAPKPLSNPPSTART